MFVIENGIKVHGITQQGWHARMICLVKTSFDQTISEPAYNAQKCLFVFPSFKGQSDYCIHILETGEALVKINGKMYLCTRQNGTPTVLIYTNTKVSAANHSSIQVVA